MGIDGQKQQETRPYSLDRAMHEARYVYGAVAAKFVVRMAMEESQAKHERANERFKQIMGTHRFSRQSIAQIQKNLALTELDRANQIRIIMMDSYRRQLDLLDGIELMRERQAQLDWERGERGDTAGMDALLEDTSHLLPEPGAAAVTQFGIDYLGEVPGPTRHEADIPYMQSILLSDPT